MKNSVWAVLAAFLWMASPAGGDPGDERILLAKDAARSGDRNRLALYAPPTGHPLDPYPEYWALSAHVARPGDINPLPILDFLERQRGSLLAERLRGEWLRALGKRGEWDTLAAEFPAMEQPEQDVKCYHLQARLGLGDAAALDDARPLWFSLVDTPESCIPVLQALVREARVSPDETWSRVRRLMEAKRFAGARAVAAWLPADQWRPRRSPLAVVIGLPIVPIDGAEGFGEAVRLRDAARAEILQRCGEPAVVSDT